MKIQDVTSHVTLSKNDNNGQKEFSLQQLIQRRAERRELQAKILQQADNILMNPTVQEVEQRTKSELEKSKAFRHTHEIILQKVNQVLLDPDVQDVEQRLQDRQKQKKINEIEQKATFQKIDDLIVDIGQSKQDFQLLHLKQAVQQQQVMEIQKSFEEVSDVFHQIKPALTLSADQIHLVSLKKEERKSKRATIYQLIDDIQPLIILLQQKIDQKQVFRVNITQKLVQIRGQQGQITQNREKIAFYQHQFLQAGGMIQNRLENLETRLQRLTLPQLATQQDKNVLEPLGIIARVLNRVEESLDQPIGNWGNQAAVNAFNMTINFAQEKFVTLTQTVSWTRTYMWSALSSLATAAIQKIHLISSVMTFINEEVIKWGCHRAWTFIKDNTHPITWIALGVISTIFVPKVIAAYPLISCGVAGYLFFLFKYQILNMVWPAEN